MCKCNSLTRWYIVIPIPRYRYLLCQLHCAARSGQRPFELESLHLERQSRDSGFAWNGSWMAAHAQVQLQKNADLSKERPFPQKHYLSHDLSSLLHSAIKPGTKVGLEHQHGLHLLGLIPTASCELVEKIQPETAVSEHILCSHPKVKLSGPSSGSPRGNLLDPGRETDILRDHVSAATHGSTCHFSFLSLLSLEESEGFLIIFARSWNMSLKCSPVTSNS